MTFTLFLCRQSHGIVHTFPLIHIHTHDCCETEKNIRPFWSRSRFICSIVRLSWCLTCIYTNIRRRRQQEDRTCVTGAIAGSLQTAYTCVALSAFSFSVRTCSSCYQCHHPFSMNPRLDSSNSKAASMESACRLWLAGRSSISYCSRMLAFGVSHAVLGRSITLFNRSATDLSGRNVPSNRNIRLTAAARPWEFEEKITIW